MDKLIQAHDEAVESRDKILSRKIFLEKEVKDRGNKLYHAYVEIKELKRRADLYSLTESTEKYINELIADNNEMKSRLQKYSYPFEIKLSTFDERRINELKLENDKLKAELQRANGNIFRKSAEINNLENQNKILQMESSNADGINADLRKRNDALESELYNGTSAMVRCADCGKISAVDIRRNPVKEDMEVRVKQCACHKQNQDKLQQEIEKLKSNIDKKDHEIGRCYDNAAVLNGKIKRKEQEINELKTELSGYKIGVSLDNRICWEAVKEIKKDELKKEDCSNSKVLEEIEKLRCRVRRAEYDFDRRCGCLEDILVKR
jgi:chromosome segregation ATPase